MFGLTDHRKKDFPTGTLDTEGDQIFPRMPVKSIAPVTKTQTFKTFSVKDLENSDNHCISLVHWHSSRLWSFFFLKKLHEKKKTYSYANVSVAIRLTVAI